MSPQKMDGAIGRPPRFDGVLRTDDAVIGRAAQDFGNIVSAPPIAVLEPGSVRDVCELVAYAAARGIPVAARGGGHSLYGQGQAAGGIVIDMSPLRQVRVTGRKAVAQAGARWSDVVAAALPGRLVPPVLTDHLGTSVGGTLSVGGIGGMSHLYGLQTDQVSALEVVTGDGAPHTCSADRESDLFDAVRAGLGQCGIIVGATLRLVEAPARAVLYKLIYDDLRTFVTDQRRLVGDPRFDHLQGRALVLPDGGWRFRLDAAAYYTPPGGPDPYALAGLRHVPGSEQAEDMPYRDFLHRGAPGEAALRATGEWGHPHPWLSLFVPERAVQPLVREVLAATTAAGLGPSGLVLLYPVLTEHLHTPLFRRPVGPVIFHFCLLRTAPGGDRAARDALIEANRDVHRRALAHGAFAYLVNALPMSRDDWQAHFGPVWQRLTRAALRYDPGQILTPGQGLRQAP